MPGETRSIFSHRDAPAGNVDRMTSSHGQRRSASRIASSGRSSPTWAIDLRTQGTEALDGRVETLTCERPGPVDVVGPAFRIDVRRRDDVEVAGSLGEPSLQLCEQLITTERLVGDHDVVCHRARSRSVQATARPTG
jgi:hypothetical protein